MIRTKGTGYRYVDGPKISRISVDKIVHALRNAQSASGRYKAQSVFVSEVSAAYKSEFEAYWSGIRATPDESIIPGVTAYQWSKVCDRIMRQDNEEKPLLALAKTAVRSMLKNETPERLRSMCETKGLRLGLKVQTTKAVITACIHILDDIEKGAAS